MSDLYNTALTVRIQSPVDPNNCIVINKSDFDEGRMRLFDTEEEVAWWRAAHAASAQAVIEAETLLLQVTAEAEAKLLQAKERAERHRVAAEDAEARLRTNEKKR